MSRLGEIPGCSIEDVAAAAGRDPDVLRLENLDTDIRPPDVALEATRTALESDEANSYLPSEGHRPVRDAAAAT